MRTSRPWLALGWLVLAAAPGMAETNVSGGVMTTDSNGGPPPEVTAPGRPEAYGLSDRSVYTVVANATNTLVSDTTYAYFLPGITRYRTGGSLWFHAPVTIPTGALLTSFELDACDTNPGATVDAFLHRCPIGGGVCSTIAGVSSGVSATPGCAQFVSTTILTPTLDQEGFQYDMEVAITGTDSATRFGAVRLGWRRQVSPSPAVATFPVDVPTSHGFFRFIEALASAGVTAGCGSGMYCPDEPVTRGQMAVFLAVALGLHWPN